MALASIVAFLAISTCTPAEGCPEDRPDETKVLEEDASELPFEEIPVAFNDDAVVVNIVLSLVVEGANMPNPDAIKSPRPWLVGVGGVPSSAERLILCAVECKALEVPSNRPAESKDDEDCREEVLADKEIVVEFR